MGGPITWRDAVLVAVLVLLILVLFGVGVTPGKVF